MRESLDPRLKRFISRSGSPRFFLIAAMVIFLVVFGELVVQRHAYFATFDYDMGIFDQGTWLISRGQSFMTVRGLDFWGHHANFALILFTPFYWLDLGGPDLLNVAMTASYALGAVPVFLFGRRLLGDEWQALALSLAYLLHFTAQWAINETFHPETMAIFPFLMAYVRADEKRWRSYALWLIFALSWKEDVALAALMLGFVLLIRKEWRVGVATMGFSLAWFVFATQVLIPHYSPSGAFYAGFFGALGETPTELIQNSVTNPTIITRRIDEVNGLGYVRDMQAPYGGLSLLSPLTLLMSVPNTLVNLLNIHGLSANLLAHYTAMPMAVTTLAMVEGVARFRRAGWRWLVVVWVLTCSVTSAAAWGLTPFSVAYNSGQWPLHEPSRQDLFERAVTLPPDDAVVAATYTFVPHMTHRERIYTFPNPWILSYWGIDGLNQHDPADIDWLVLNLDLVSEEGKEVVDRELASGDWIIDLDSNRVLVAHRVES